MLKYVMHFAICHQGGGNIYISIYTDEFVSFLSSSALRPSSMDGLVVLFFAVPSGGTFGVVLLCVGHEARARSLSPATAPPVRVQIGGRRLR